MNTNSNSFYGAILGALVVVLAFALLSTRAAWRNILLGPQPKTPLVAMNHNGMASAGSDTQGYNSAPPSQEAGQPGASVTEEKPVDGESIEAPAAAKTPPPATPSPLGYKSPRARVKPGSVPAPETTPRQRSYAYGQLPKRAAVYYMGDDRLSQQVRDRLRGPHVIMDATVYDRPDGTPLPAPSLTKDELIVLRGTRIRLGERRGAWQEILTPAGQRGWVRARQVSS
jgi:hypothetical protein